MSALACIHVSCHWLARSRDFINLPETSTGHRPFLACFVLELWGRPCIVILRFLHAGMTISFYSADTDKSFYVHGRLWFRCTYRTLENYLASPMLALHTCALGLDDTLAHLAKAFCHVGCHSLGLGPAINRLDAGKVLWEGTE